MYSISSLTPVKREDNPDLFKKNLKNYAQKIILVCMYSKNLKIKMISVENFQAGPQKNL